ncbi:MAG TPA: FHA domain-containing protein [Verrucomicrobiae bacterium]|jgi:hypothetical protein
MSVQHKQIDNELLVGRRVSEEGIKLPDDEFLGHRHFAIRRNGDECILKDLGSTD